MSWNYRVIRKRVVETYEGAPEFDYQIHEVYYNELREPTSISVEPVSAYGESMVELLGELERMAEAVRKPVLDYDSFTIKVHEGKTT